MTDFHWHAFGWSGQAPPPDSQARDINAAVMPRELIAWFSKPAALHYGAHTSAEGAYAWLEAELQFQTTRSGRPASDMLARAKLDLDLGQDAYIAFYTRGGFMVRTLLTCPRTGADKRPVRCPGKIPPRQSSPALEGATRPESRPASAMGSAAPPVTFKAVGKCPDCAGMGYTRVNGEEVTCKKCLGDGRAPA